MSQMLKLIGANLLVLGFLVTMANVAAIAGIKYYHASKPKQYAQSHLYPNYREAGWALTHFTEYDNLTKGYYESFYGWRRPAIRGATINVDADGLRRTVHPAGAEPSRTIAFFGGSTTWGTGADDAGTIPSRFAARNPDFRATNYGETGYVAHQSLNLFMRRYFEGERPDVVVFYDGVNDVWHKCRRELDAYSHSREFEIRTVLGEHSPDASFLNILKPAMIFLGKARRTLQNRNRADQSFYDCAKDQAKAEMVARVLLSDWMIVKHLVESYGGTFLGILQPQAYDSASRLEHLQLDEDLGRQYGVVYPLIVELLDRDFPALGDNFVDLRRALDGDDYYYIDWCHLSPNGNEVIAGRISDALADRTERATARR